MIETGHAHDDLRRVPVYSLYSETREPTAEMLKDLDVLVVDLQDVGTRIYTYIYTMAYCLTAARKHDLRSIVCDRPNPIGGASVEGPMLEPGFESFVGLYPIPMRHGMTIGELARLFNEHFGIGAKLEVVQMEGWRREMYHDDAGAPWVMPSPNMPTLDTAIVYPGTVLFEGTNVSEGRGHDPAVRADWRALGDRRTICGCSQPARAGWRRFSSRGVRTDVSQTRERVVRRMPASRDRPQDIPARSERPFC